MLLKKWTALLARVLVFALLAELALGGFPAVSAASSSELKEQIQDLKDEKEDLKAQMEDLREQYAQTGSEIADIISEKNLLDQEIFLLYGQIENLNRQISTINLLIADQQVQVDKAQDRLAQLNQEHRERIRTMEEDGGMSYWSVIFKAKSFADLLDRVSMIQEIAAADRRRLDALDQAARELQAAQEALEADRAILQGAWDELKEVKNQMESKREEWDKTIRSLQEKAREIEGLQEELETADQQILEEIARKEQEYNEAKYQEWLDYIATLTTAPPETTRPPQTQPTQPPQTVPPQTQPPTRETETPQTTAPQPPETEKPTQAPTQATEPQETQQQETEPKETAPKETEPPQQTQPPSSESWLKPCEYVMVSSPFGNRESPTAGASTYHQGVDLAGPEGTPIVASRSGTVTIATYSNSAGFFVSINHGDGFSSVYMHMTHFTVSPGEQVSAGQVIGYMGSTGISTGSHLHFGISYNGTYVNPALYITL